MKILKVIVLGGFIAVLGMMFGSGGSDVSTTNNEYYYSSEYNNDATVSNYTTETTQVEVIQTQPDVTVSQYTEDTEIPQEECYPEIPDPTEEAYSDTNQTAPMPEDVFTTADIIGKWVDDTNPDQIKVVDFYVENNQLMHRFYFIVPGNSIGINLANDTTEWECSEGIVSVMNNQGTIYCHVGTGETISISFYYGFDGPDVMYDQTDGTAYYRAE